MGATFSRLKNWIAEILRYADLNAEIDNILANLTPAGIDDLSSNVAAMQATTDPGEVGTESLATSVAGELQRLRFAIKDIKGTGAAQWYSTPTASLTDFLNAIGGSLVNNRIISGTTSSQSSAPRFLVPNGSAATCLLDGSPTAFVYAIAGTQYTISTDVTVSGLSLAAASNNTALVNDVKLTAQEYSKWQGEDGSILTIDTVGTGISALVGQYGAFKIVHGGNTEYFIGYVNSATTITNCLRGCFFDSAVASIPRVAISDNDTITLMKLTWLFANTAGAVVAYSGTTNPLISYTQPSDTLTYWFDIATSLWKTYNGSAWVASNSTLIGICAQDTAACKVARGFSFHGTCDAYSNAIIEYTSATVVTARNVGTKVGVGTSLIDYKTSRALWDITSNLESGFTEAASTTYFIYVGESGQVKLSPTKPYFSADIGRGWYHPYEVWRALGSIQNNAGSNFDAHTMKNYLVDQNSIELLVPADDMKNLSVTASVAANAMTVVISGADGSDLSPGNPAYVNFRSVTATVGTIVTRKLIANLTIVVPQGATLGTTGSMDQYEWIYLADNAGVIDIGIAAQVPFADNALVTSTQISAGATSNGTLYSTGTAFTSKPVRVTARIKTTQASTSNWATAPLEVLMKPVLQYNIEPWTNSRTFTPDATPFGTVSNVDFWTRRVGDTLEVKGYFRAGTVTGNPAKLTLPLNINTGKISSTAMRMSVGSWFSLSTGGGTAMGAASRLGSLMVDTGSDGAALWFNSRSAAGGIGEKTNATTTGGSDDGYSLYFSVPINGWEAYGP